MELREIFVTALAIMDEKSGSQANGGYEMLWTGDWDHLRELLLEGAQIDKTEEIVGLNNKPVWTIKVDLIDLVDICAEKVEVTSWCHFGLVAVDLCNVRLVHLLDKIDIDLLQQYVEGKLVSNT